MILSFRIGKIPVRIQPTFFLVALFFASGEGDLNLGLVVTWTAIVLASVLAHEMGHAAAGLAFGLEPSIAIHGMGGTTSWARSRPLSTARRVAISIAGPASGFALGAMALLLHAWGGDRVFGGDHGRFVFATILWVNVGWGVLNLLPMLPLDGGDIMRQLLQAATHGRGERPARIVSVVCAGLATAAAVAVRSWWSTLLAASFVASNWRALRDLAASEHDTQWRPALEAAYAALDAKDGPRILELARPAALGAKTAAVRAEALQLLAFGFLLDDRAADADAAIAGLPPGYAPHPSLVALRREVGGAGSEGAELPERSTRERPGP